MGKKEGRVSPQERDSGRSRVVGERGCDGAELESLDRGVQDLATVVLQQLARKKAKREVRFTRKLS